MSWLKFHMYKKVPWYYCFCTMHYGIIWNILAYGDGNHFIAIVYTRVSLYYHLRPSLYHATPTFTVFVMIFYHMIYCQLPLCGVNLENWPLTDKLCILTHRMKATSLSAPSDTAFLWVMAWNVHSMADYFPLWQDKHTVSCLKDFAHSKDLKVELQRRWISEIRDLS